MTFEQLMKANETIKKTDIKGKEYAEVNQRIKVFRMLYPEGSIVTDILDNSDGVVVMKASVIADGVVLATGHAYEKESSTYINKTSYIENCETSAVGRALGMLGIGIDTSIASYEEVSNAIAQQAADSVKKDMDNIDRMQKAKGTGKVTPATFAELKKVMADKDIEEGYILKCYKVKSLTELLEEDALQVITFADKAAAGSKKWKSGVK